MNRGHRVKPVGRIDFRADDEQLTPYAGLAVVGALARRLDVVGLIDGELACERRAAPVKVRKRGVSAGELVVVAIAESQLVGAECCDDNTSAQISPNMSARRRKTPIPSSSRCSPTAISSARTLTASHSTR